MTVELPETPENRKEAYLADIAGQDVVLPDEPANRIEQYLAYIAENGSGGGGSYSAGGGIDITNNTISVDTDTIQEKLTAGAGIDITDNTISATGGLNVRPILVSAMDDPSNYVPIPLSDYQQIENACLDLRPLVYAYTDINGVEFTNINDYQCSRDSLILISINSISGGAKGVFALEYNGGSPQAMYNPIEE